LNYLIFKQINDDRAHVIKNEITKKEEEEEEVEER
jgi:hypothetical protein